jgi:2'-5' RNA ligase superfamily
MPCGAALFFDEKTDAAIRGLWQVIEDAGLPSNMLKLSYAPHLSVLVCDDTDIDALRKVLPVFIASHTPLPLSFHSLGVFGGKDGVVYLAPTVTQQLLDFHTELWNLIEPYTKNAQEYYRPDIWVPHVTLDLEVPLDQVGAVVETLLRVDFPKEGLIKELLIAGFPDDEPGLEELFKARLGSYL